MFSFAPITFEWDPPLWCS